MATSSKSKWLLRLLLALGLFLTADSSAWARSSKEFDLHVDAAERYYKVDDYDQSIAELKAAYALQPAAWLLINIGRCHFKANRPVEALEAYNQALKAKPSPAEQKELLASINSAVLKRDRQREDELQAQRAATAAQQSVMLTSAPLPVVEKKPIYQKAWFWGTIGGVVVAGVLVGVLVARPWEQRIPEPSPTPGPTDPVLR